MTATATGSIFVLDPTAPPRELRHTMAPRPPDLRGKSVGFLWNSKPNGDILFARLEELLRQKYEITNAVHQRKPSASIAAKQEVMDELTTSAHVAIIGLGDWGSCTSWSIHDSVELERRGVPTVTVCTHRFKVLGEVERRALGMPELPMAIAPHPLGGLKPDAVEAKAEALLEQVIAGLTAQE